MNKNIHRCCLPCWGRREPNREPVRIKEAREDICCICGCLTEAGIYIFNKDVFKHCEGNHSEKKEEEGDIPYIGFSGDTLAKCPPAKAGDEFRCRRCGLQHILKGAPGVSDTLFYSCGEKTYLGGVGGKLVVFTEPDVSG